MFMNQGKLEVVKQEMARVNVDILGISELKWTGMGEFNSDYHYIYYGGQESLRRNGVATKVNKGVQNSVLGYNHTHTHTHTHTNETKQNDFCSFQRQSIQYHCDPSVCPNQ